MGFSHTNHPAIGGTPMTMEAPAISTASVFDLDAKHESQEVSIDFGWQVHGLTELTAWRKTAEQS